MNRNEFVRAIHDQVYISAIDTVKKYLGSQVPEGANMLDNDVRAWFATLGCDQQDHVLSCIEVASYGAIFGLLCVISGSRLLSDDPDEEFELWSVKGDQKTLLGSIDAGGLHGEFGAIVPELRRKR